MEQHEKSELVMFEYPKIETLFQRDLVAHKVTQQLRKPEFALPRKWLVTEKIDGMNIRVYFSGTWIEFSGRSDNAQLPPRLLEILKRMFTVEKLTDFYGCDATWLFFGEGYGPKIQKAGAHLRHDEFPSFRLFDVAVKSANRDRYSWLEWRDVEITAKELGIKTVPFITEYDGPGWPVHLLGRRSAVAAQEGDNDFVAEGIVCRTNPTLHDRWGNRIMWKLKVRDF